MIPNPATGRTVHAQLTREIAVLYRRARAILGEQCEATVAGVSRFYWRELAMDTPDADETTLATRARQAAHDIATELHVQPDFRWWGTPLGRACAWHIGYYQQDVPREVVAEVLDISRQAVHDRVRRVGGFTAEMLRDAYRAQWDALTGASRRAML